MKTLLLIVSWIIGCALAITGLVLLFTAPWSGIILIAASLLVLPPVRALVYAKTHKRLTFGIRTLLVIVLFVGSMFLVSVSAIHTENVHEAQQKAKAEQVKAAQLAKVKQENEQYFATHRSDVLASITKSITSKHYQQAIAKAKKYTSTNDPKLKELYATAKQGVVSKQKAAQAAQQLKKQESVVAQIEQRLTTNRHRLKSYYSSAAQVKQAELDVVQLAFIKAAYDKSKKASEVALSRKASSLIPRVSQQARVLYASALENVFMKSGMNTTVKAIGRGKKHLRITYALMSKVLVYKFQNKVKLFKQAKPIGFTRIEYTNGFSGSMGETWTVKL